MTVLIGADPEFFLYDTEKNMYVSAHDKIPGTKRHPFKVDGGAIQVDGLAVEFNINPTDQYKIFEDEIRQVVGYLRRTIPQKYEFRFEPYVEFEENYFNKEVPHRAKELGCDPDYNYYRNGQPNDRPNPYGSARTAGGHIHIGWTSDKEPHERSHFFDCTLVISRVDSWYAYRRPLWDTDHKRVRLYGSNGTFRPKSYGVEYRTPSNKWLAYPRIWPAMFYIGKYTVEDMENGGQKGSIKIQEEVDALCKTHITDKWEPLKNDDRWSL